MPFGPGPGSTTPVPAVDAATNTSMRDVVGNKSDATAVGGISAVESLVAYLKEAVLGVGYDGVTDFTDKFNEFSVAGVQFGAHDTASILFITPEAVGSINSHNTAILTELQKIGRVDHITQSDALTYPHFAEYNIVVCGTDNGTAWTLSNLNHVKEFPEPVICVDASIASHLLMGVDGGDAAAKTVLTAVSQIKANDLGIGVTGVVGLAGGANTISSSATYNTLDMSDADITETFFGTEAVADNTDVLLAVIFKRQPDGTRGILSDATEATGSRYFYGPAFSAGSLNTLGLAVLELVGRMAIQTTTAVAGFEISGDIGDLETKIFGNQANEFNNGNPMVEYLTGRNSSGTRLAIGKSLYDILGTAYVDGAGGFTLESIQDDLKTLGQYLIDGTAGGEAGTVLPAGQSLADLVGLATQAGKTQVNTVTIDLNQAAANYTLFTGTAQVFMLEGLVFSLPNIDVSNDVNITSISIQTDDVTAAVIIDSVTGAKANLTAEAQLAWTGLIRVTVGTQVQLTISGGAADVATVCNVEVIGRSLVDGGNLA